MSRNENIKITLLTNTKWVKRSGEKRGRRGIGYFIITHGREQWDCLNKWSLSKPIIIKITTKTNIQTFLKSENTYTHTCILNKTTQTEHIMKDLKIKPKRQITELRLTLSALAKM